MADDLLGMIRALQRRVELLEGGRQATRQDLRDVNGTLRVRLGQQDDGSWGLRVWTSAGSLAIDHTTTA